MMPGWVMKLMMRWKLRTNGTTPATVPRKDRATVRKLKASLYESRVKANDLATRLKKEGAK
jgi:hypothetical protein